jgi:hypothetical protein
MTKNEQIAEDLAMKHGHSMELYEDIKAALDQQAAEHGAEVAKLKAEVEVMAWNLGGCSTLALGYDLDKEFSKEMARPALWDVKKLATEHAHLLLVLGEAYEALNESVALNINWSSDAEPSVLEYFSEYRATIKQGKATLKSLSHLIKQGKP